MSEDASLRPRTTADLGWYGRLQDRTGALRRWLRHRARNRPAALRELGTRQARAHRRPHAHKVPDDAGARLLAIYTGISYRLLGHRLDQHPDRHLDERLRQADVPFSAGLFRAMQVLTTGLAFAATLLLLLVVFTIAALPQGGLIALAIAVVAATLTTVAFPTTLSNRITNRKRAIERDLPFSLSELSVLASIGLSPIELMRRMAARAHDPAMTDVFRAIVHRTDIQGKDLITALAETAKESPSAALRETLWDLGNMIHQGGDLGTYLQQQSSEVLELKRANQKSFIDQLTTYADAYVTVVLIGVIFIAIGAFLLDAFGRTAGPLDAGALLALLAYGVLPLIVLVVGIMLSSAYSAHE